MMFTVLAFVLSVFLTLIIIGAFVTAWKVGKVMKEDE